MSGCKLRLEKSVHFDLTTYNPHKGGGNFINFRDSNEFLLFV